jgi:hypothetical protein
LECVISSFEQFLDISIPASNVQKSLTFYPRIGFSELRLGAIRDYHRAVVSDGSVYMKAARHWNNAKSM